MQQCNAFLGIKLYKWQDIVESFDDVQVIAKAS